MINKDDIDRRLSNWNDRLIGYLTPRRLWSLPPAWRYLMALAMAVSAVVLRHALIPWMRLNTPYNVSAVAIVMATVLLGIGPGLLTVLVSILGVETFVMGSLPADPNEIALLRVGMACSIGVFLCWILHSIRISQIRSSESEERLAAFAAATFEGVVESESGRIVDCNAQFAQMFGYDVKELKGKTVTDLIAPEDRELMAAHIRENRESIIELSAMRRDGTPIFVEAHNRPVSQNNSRCHMAMRDLTRRKLAEEALRSSRDELELRVGERTRELRHAVESVKRERERLYDVLETLPVIIVLLTSDYHIAFANRFFLDRFGDSGGKRCYEYLFNLSEPCGKCETYVVLKSGAPHSWCWTGPDGRDYEIYNYPFTDADGSLLILEMGIDVTERERADNALKSAYAYNRSLIEASPDPLVTIGHDGRITDVNAATERITGRSRDTLIGTDFSEYFTEPERARTGYRQVFDKGSVRDYELDIRHSDGHVTPVLYNASVYRGEGGEVVGVFAAARDMGERRNLEAQLRQAQKMEAIGQLSGGIAHDFNNILTTIIGYGNILKMKLDDNDPGQADIDQILAASERAAHLTRSMLAYSRKQFMAPRHADLNDIVRNSEKFLRRVIGERLEFISSYTDRPLQVFADTVQIEQVLINLATNARDSMPGGGTLAIGTESFEIDDTFIDIHKFAKIGPYAVITLSDTGAGMDKGTMEKIFEPFFTTKEVGKGTGLGLSVVYGIVKQHDGFVTCYSEPGRGTSFRIYLPISRGDAPEEEPLQEIPTTGGGETILLAEDDPASRSVSRLYLERFGYRVIEAVDGEEAVRKFKEKRDEIDLALLDVIMPGLNGREVYDRIKEIRADVKVIFMSGYTADIIHMEEFAAEGLMVLTKPSMLKDMLQKIRGVLDS